jgi:hypothetical protein
MGHPPEIAMLTAVLPVVGVLVGASLQYFFTRYLETQRHQRDLRTQAYLDYIRAMSGLGHLKGGTSYANSSRLSLMRSARTCARS